MAESDFLSATDLLNFNRQVQGNSLSGMASQAIGGWSPNMTTWSPTEQGLGSFGKTFLSALLGNYARQDASDQLSKVVSVLPQLGASPNSVAVPEGVDADAFNVLKGKAALGDMMASVLGKQQKEVARNKVLGELEAYGVNQDGSGLKVEDVPGSPQYNAKIKAQENKFKENEGLINLRKEFNALDPVKNFAKATQAATALSGALKDKGKVADQELVRYSIQMIEPGMAVREGEQNAVASSQSIPEEWKAKMKSALEGQSVLGDDIRAGIERLASRAYNSHKGLYDQAFDMYGNEAKMQGFDPGRLSYIGQAPSAETIFQAKSTPKYSVDQLTAAGYDQNDIIELQKQGLVE
jgi:hypothetical protein